MQTNQLYEKKPLGSFYIIQPENGSGLLYSSRDLLNKEHDSTFK